MKKSMKKLLSLVMAVALAASLTACGSGKTSETTAGEKAASGESSEAAKASGEGSFKIGGIGPITGSTAIYGQAVMRGAELAIDEINANGGINGTQIEYSFQDDENDTEKAVNAYNTLKDWGMQMLVGTVTSAPCIAVGAESSNDNIFQLTPSGSAVDCAKFDNQFRVCFSDPNQGAASAQYIGENKLATKVAIIYDSSDVYSSGIHDKFLSEAANQGIEIVSDEAFTADNNTNFSVQLLTPFAADAKDELTQKFVTTFKEKYGETPNQFAADGYDAVYAIKAAAEKAAITADMDASAICDALKTSMTEVSVNGLTGENMKWSKDGEPDKAPKAVKIVNGVYTAM